MFTAWYDSFSVIMAQALYDVVAFLPKIIAALLIFIIGSAVAKGLRKIVVRLFETFKVSSAVQKTPIEHFFKSAEVGEKIEDALGSVFYWLVMIVVIQTAFSVLGLQSLTSLLDKIISYLPQVLSAVIVLLFGVLLAGVVESLLKGAIRSIDGQSGRLLGKIASYLVMTIAVLAAISELGIATSFITILFIGVVATLSLGVGLAMGLGGKDLVRTILEDGYKKFKSDVSEDRETGS